MKQNTIDINPLKLKWLPFATASAVALCATLANAQEEPDENVYELSPFVISTEDSDGYVATSTLAGTRLKSELKDLAGAVQILTQDFLDDTAATSADELLMYTTSTEVSGPDGNFSGANGGEEDDGARRAAETPTRVRGLISADRTRDYFLSDIGFESYNTDRVVVNRGPNSILFGLGSPGGIINNNTKKAVFRPSHELSMRIGSFGSHRETMDINHEIIDDKWAIRAIALNKRQGYQQEEGFQDEQRVFITTTARLTENTTLRANAEFGSTDSARPSNLAPKRSTLTWIENGMYTNPFVGREPTTEEYIELYGSDKRLFQGLFTNRGPQFLLSDAANMEFTLGLHGAGGGPTGGNLGMTMVRNASEEANRRLPSMTEEDRWFFDFRNHYLPGRSNTQSKDFYAYNVALEHTFLDDKAGVEVAYDLQSYEWGYIDRLRKTPYVDVSEYLVNGDPNPNVRRPFLESIPLWQSNKRDREAVRLTAYYDLDFREFDNKILKWFGRHIITANYTEQSIDTKQWGANYGDVTDLSVDEMLEANRGATGLGANSWDRRVTGFVYVGDPVMGSSSDSMYSVTIGDITSFPAYVYDSRATPVNEGDRGAYVERDINVITRPITYASLDRQELKATAMNMQSYLLDSHLVITAGWRKDESSQFTDRDPDRTSDRVVLLDTLEIPEEASNTVTGEIFSWGAVAHLPTQWSERFLGGVGLSAHYGESENFQPQPGRLNVWGEELASPGGNTTEYGFTFSLPNSKFQLRVNWYETAMTGLSTGGSGSIPNWERLFYNNVRSLEQDGANANWAEVYTLPPQEMRDLYWDPANPDPSVGGTLSVSDRPNSNVTDTRDLAAEGIELEGIYNITKQWTVTFNVAKQKSIQSNIRPAQQKYLDVRIPQWEAMGDLVIRPWGQTVAEATLNTHITPILSAAALEGAINPEVREWRANFVTRYKFKSDGWLKGVKVGGAFRWESKPAIGFELKDFNGRLIDDIDKPLYGPSRTNVDFFCSREQKILDGKIDWIVQVNVRNVLNNDDLIPIAKDYDGTIVSARIPNPTTFLLTNTFKF